MDRINSAVPESLTFAVFSDFHYKEGMYLSPLADMEAILKRANDNKADFIIHSGDLCNDFKGSPELVNLYLDNAYGLPAYGVYGNHELESEGNSMEIVTPLLTNRKDSVIWGTSDGKIGNGGVAYYYFDKGNFRIVCTDTNYSYSEALGEWQHNTTNSYGEPQGNIYVNSLGPVQLEWLEKVLMDAANSGKQCIVMGHATFNTYWGGYSSDAEAVLGFYKKANAIRKGTVIMSVNGHYHTNRTAVSDGIVFFDVNTTRNGYWKCCQGEHYSTEHTFEYIKYNENGSITSVETAPIEKLWQSQNTWFFDAPLSAIVTVSSAGEITIEGSEANWLYGIVPPNISEYTAPEITDGSFEI